MRTRKPDETGQGQRVAVMNDGVCYNAQACFEVCPNDAIIMHELEEPVDVGMDMNLDPDQWEAINDLCAKAGYPPNLEICMCTTTSAAEIAAAILDGAHTPEAVSLKTGARTGCLELCLQPIIDFLYAAGHTDMPLNPKNGFQWYGRSSALKDNMTPAMLKVMELSPKFKILDKLGIDRVKSKIGRLMFSGKSPLISAVVSWLTPAMIKKEIVEEFKQYTPEEDLQNMIRYFAMHSIASSNTKTKDGSNDQH
jgi:bacterioferritin-associated ferredoxin